MGQLCGSAFGTSISLACLPNPFTSCPHWFFLPLCSSTSYLSYPQLYHSIRKGKIAGRLPAGGGEGDEKEKCEACSCPVGELNSCRAALNHKVPKWKLLLAPRECRVSPHMCSHGFLFTKSEKTVFIQTHYVMSISLELHMEESPFGSLAIVSLPSYSALNSSAATENVHSETGHPIDI